MSPVGKMAAVLLCHGRFLVAILLEKILQDVTILSILELIKR